ncbi:MAG: Asp-tRNA(Asn)/Glu-tRNA(Gln) amidotransferase GatCAB subunit A, partial [Methanobacterium sp.]|nr:Asp-tRNA(Asn)/Glu-tRNA(Gln) amidotransferase GatCAB subunit A [Methanobacterium sp.]
MNLLEKSELIKNHEITALENLEEYHKEIEKKNSSLNVFLETDINKARESAEQVDSRIKKGEKVGKLAGMVIGVKSNINVEDFHITAASRTLENYQGSYNATV